jgi:ribosomal protein S18 acetylase RimI-like enzyme
VLSSDYILRDYQEPDIPQILAVIKAAFAEYRGKLDPPSSAERKTVEIVRAELEKAAAIVAQIDDNPIGCVFYQPLDDAVYIDRLAVLPEYRNRGISSALLQRVEEKARARGFTALTLSVRVSLTRQQAYYRKLGFKDYGFGIHDGFSEPTSVKMKKMLAV